MSENKLPLTEVSVKDLFINNKEDIYLIPIYQRNYAWGRDEIRALVQDVYDAYCKEQPSTYYVGTLVTYYHGDHVYEVIDGQQRLTTIRLILAVFQRLGSFEGSINHNKLGYQARKRSDDTIRNICDLNKVENADEAIINGYRAASEAVKDIVSGNNQDSSDKEIAGYTKFFLEKVHLIYYQVPKDVDLNQYFEVMNSRGEQLEMHEIVKANLMQRLENDHERHVFHLLWDACSQMGSYVQQNFSSLKLRKILFGSNLDAFLPVSFDSIVNQVDSSAEDEEENKPISIIDIIYNKAALDENQDLTDKNAGRDYFQPIIDFPNFLLIVLKITRMAEPDFNPSQFNLDDKELLHEFDKKKIDVKQFIFTLLKARFFLDNYVVHHSNEDDTLDNNPWKLQIRYQNSGMKHSELRNLYTDLKLQTEMVHALSMFEVSFTARQRKNYLFYCLIYLVQRSHVDLVRYKNFVEKLADCYFQNIYLDSTKLNARNVPVPGSFDSVILEGNKLADILLDDDRQIDKKESAAFTTIFGDGTSRSKGVPLFVFNYLDFRIWKYYAAVLRGSLYSEDSAVRKDFFIQLGCSDFGLKIFDQFYFSRTRRSLEHFYPQAMATGKDGNLDENQINCFGNYAMIGAEVNSAGSDWSPEGKLIRYLDSSHKISQISVASLKFMIMMQKCRDDGKWEFNEIKEHQKLMIVLLMK